MTEAVVHRGMFIATGKLDAEVAKGNVAGMAVVYITADDRKVHYEMFTDPTWALTLLGGLDVLHSRARDNAKKAE